MRPVVLLALLPANVVLAVTPESSPVVLRAIQSGEIIGASAACGAPEKRLTAIGRKVIYGIRADAKSPGEVDRAQVRHEQAVRRGAEQVQSGRVPCAAALKALEDLDGEMVRL